MVGRWSEFVRTYDPKWLPRLLYDRLSEPVHLNLISALIALFGSYRMKIAFDLIRWRPYAYGLLRAAELAKSRGLQSVSVVEMGVGSGEGLLNMCKIALRLQQATGIKFSIYGFDSGAGLPPPRDYRDHPELFQPDDYPMNREKLEGILPRDAHLILGYIAQTVPGFLEGINPSSPLGFVSVDVNYYFSTKDALMLLADPEPSKYLPVTVLYLDDIVDESQNSWCGSLLAVDEFNSTHGSRKIEKDRFLRSRRIFKRPGWIDQMYMLHVLDHPLRQVGYTTRQPIVQRAPRALSNGELMA